MTAKEPMTELFSKAGLSALRDFIDRKTLFAFDLDGTLAPIIADPAQITITDKIRKRLVRLNRLARVAIVTGRARKDALMHLGFTPGFLVGNHGAEGLPGNGELENSFIRLCIEWERQLRKLLPNDENAGMLLENKGATLSMHYRNAPDQNAAHQRILDAIHRLTPAPRRIAGKFVENLTPVNALHKGEALLRIMSHLECKRALFVGDDETDEDVFRLGNDAIFGIRIGLNPQSAARNFISRQNEIELLLDEIIAILEPNSGIAH